MKISLVQLNAELGNVEDSLSKAETFIIKAIEASSEIILFPEFFTSSMGFSKSMLEVPIKNQNVSSLLIAWSSKYNIIIGGSFLVYENNNVYNQFQLVFPNGEVYKHNKDIPTQYENCYFTRGDTNHILQTPIGNIGIALCWEQIRTDTIKRMIGKVDFILSGSCWWDLPVNAPKDRDSLRLYNQTLAIETPITLAKFLGVPVFHSAHCGSITTERFPEKEVVETRNLVGATQAIQSSGEVVHQRLWSEGEGIITVGLDSFMMKKTTPLEFSESYWIPNLPDSYINAWNTFNPLGEKYYKEVALPYYRSKIKNTLSD